jgi:hypothetical protein
MLPPGAGLLYLADPAEMPMPPLFGNSISLSPLPSRGSRRDERPLSLPPSSLSPTAVLGTSSRPEPKEETSSAAEDGVSQQGAAGQRVPASANQAVMELMDCPHPLETLADPNAYLSSGTISRYHNPDNYTSVSLARIDL